MTQADAGESSDLGLIQALMAERVAAWNRHDLQAWAMTFTPDARFTSWRGDHVLGLDAIREFHRPLFAGQFLTSEQRLVGSTRNCWLRALLRPMHTFIPAVSVMPQASSSPNVTTAHCVC